MPKRPGRAPKDPRDLDVKLRFDTVEQGLEVRRRGGGTYVKRLLMEALGLRPAVTAELAASEDALEVRVSIPREHLD